MISSNVTSDKSVETGTVRIQECGIVLLLGRGCDHPSKRTSIKAVTTRCCERWEAAGRVHDERAGVCVDVVVVWSQQHRLRSKISALEKETASFKALIPQLAETVI